MKLHAKHNAGKIWLSSALILGTGLILGANTVQAEDVTHNDNVAVTNTSSFMKATASLDRQSQNSQSNPLKVDSSYILHVSLTNTSAVGEVIPKGTTITVSVKPQEPVTFDKFLNFTSISQNGNDFTLLNNGNGTATITLNHDLTPGQSNFVLNLTAVSPDSNWDGANHSEDPTPVEGALSLSLDSGSYHDSFYQDTLYVKPNSSKIVSSGVAGWGQAGTKDSNLMDSNYPNEQPVIDGTNNSKLANPGNISTDNHHYFSYTVNYQPYIAKWAYNQPIQAILGIKSELDFDLNHYALYYYDNDSKTYTNITNDPRLKWTVTNNQIQVDATEYIKEVGLGQLFLRSYVPVSSVTATNKTNYTTSWFTYPTELVTFQEVGSDSNLPYFRGNDATIYDNENYNPLEEVYAFLGTQSLTDKIQIVDYDGYPQNGQTPLAGVYNIKYQVVADNQSSQTFTRLITVLKNKSQLVTKSTSLIAGPKPKWQLTDAVETILDQDGRQVDPKKVTLMNPTSLQTMVPGTYTLIYQYIDDTGRSVLQPAQVNVMASLAGLSVKNSDFLASIGKSWSPVDNFVAATDEYGRPIDITEVQTSGSVNLTKAGIYPVTYTYTDGSGNIFTKMATITVKDQTSIQVNNLTLIAGPKSRLSKNDIIIKGLNEYGQPINPQNVSITDYGQLDTKTPGIYSVAVEFWDELSSTYITVPLQVHVIESKASLVVTDSTVLANKAGKWSAQDNFVSATDEYGHSINITEVRTDGSVDLTKAGMYPVTYIYTDGSGNVLIKSATILVSPIAQSEVGKSTNSVEFKSDKSGLESDGWNAVSFAGMSQQDPISHERQNKSNALPFTGKLTKSNTLITTVLIVIGFSALLFLRLLGFKKSMRDRLN